jgi:hypothetical protein
MCQVYFTRYIVCMLSNSYLFLNLGGAGEGQQHLSPSGQIPNRPEVKTDQELPSYCDPPNPCPLGFESIMKKDKN